MPRIVGVKERRDQMLFDTMEIVPGKDHRLFGNANVGDLDKCNLSIPGCLSPDNTFIVMSMGARILGESKEAEKIILGYLRFCFTLGDRPFIELSGPCLSTLLDQQPRGYQMMRPIVVPVRQNVSLSVIADEEMMESVRLRYSIFGMATRDVS